MTAMADKTGTMLYLDGVSVSFDGFKAINKLSIIVHPAEMLAIIGPNGAGKTTMMDIITGKTRPDDGQVLFDGRTDLTKLDEAAIANLGIGRKFQKPTVFESQTVWDNIEMALKKPRGVFSALFYVADQADIDRITEILETIRLLPRKDGAGRVCIQEVLVNTPFIAELIKKGDLSKIDEAIRDGSSAHGMVAKNQSLFDAWQKDLITEQDAIAFSNRPTDLDLLIRTTKFERRAAEAAAAPAVPDVPSPVQEQPPAAAQPELESRREGRSRWGFRRQGANS